MGERRYFVKYITEKYEGWGDKSFDSLDQVMTFLTEHATNPNFRFQVIYGEIIEFEPAEIVKSYRPKGRL